VTRSPLEAAAAALAAGALGALAGAPLGIAVPLGAVAATNGAVSGWRSVYDWRTPKGWVAIALDSTWAGLTTAGGLLSHVLGAVRGEGGYVDEMSRRHNRHVYQRGFRARAGFAITLGNVVSNVGDMSTPRRQRLVTDHEDVHVWQARWFGPLYPVLYVGWMAGGGVVGAFIWATRRREERLTRVMETCAYYLNPFEWWAYSRDGHWPPKRMVAGIGWGRPVVRSLAARRPPIV
jgi:hypothetical protein